MRGNRWEWRAVFHLWIRNNGRYRRACPLPHPVSLCKKSEESPTARHFFDQNFTLRSIEVFPFELQNLIYTSFSESSMHLDFSNFFTSHISLSTWIVIELIMLAIFLPAPFTKLWICIEVLSSSLNISPPFFWTKSYFMKTRWQGLCCYYLF